ncbi:MAG: hybrid sensor histidine kinase/response regulator [Bacteroidota bacterium]
MEMLKVLVVDDEPGIRSGIDRILSRYTVGYPFMDEDIGYTVYEASTGEEAIRFFHENPPDVVLLDNKLPGMGGVEVLEYIKRNQLNIEVMMITSFASLELAVKATNIGAYDFVPKPFTPQELRSSMDNITKHLFLKRMTQKMNKEGKTIRFQFLTVLSHELKNPLNAVEGYLKMMQERQSGDTLADYDEIIERALTRVKAMRSMIMDLLDLTKIESGKKNREIQQVDVIRIAKVSMETMGPLSIQMEVSIELDAPKELFVKADPEELEIIFNNLISNAVKYNKTGGKVTCRLRTDDIRLYIDVEDTGLGIPEDDIPTLFRDFSRIRSKETRHILGSGLGLSIIKRLVDLYEGTIEVQSEVGKGSTFKVVLPIIGN